MEGLVFMCYEAFISRANSSISVTWPQFNKKYILSRSGLFNVYVFSLQIEPIRPSMATDALKMHWAIKKNASWVIYS